MTPTYISTSRRPAGVKSLQSFWQCLRSPSLPVNVQPGPSAYVRLDLGDPRPAPTVCNQQRLGKRAGFRRTCPAVPRNQGRRALVNQTVRDPPQPVGATASVDDVSRRKRICLPVDASDPNAVKDWAPCPTALMDPHPKRLRAGMQKASHFIA